MYLPKETAPPYFASLFSADNMQDNHMETTNPDESTSLKRGHARVQGIAFSTPLRLPSTEEPHNFLNKRHLEHCRSSTPTSATSRREGGRSELQPILRIVGPYYRVDIGFYIGIILM